MDGWLLALAARLVREVGALIAGAAQARKPLATFGLDATVRFANPADRAAFAEELATTVATLISHASKVPFRTLNVPKVPFRTSPMAHKRHSRPASRAGRYAPGGESATTTARTELANSTVQRPEGHLRGRWARHGAALGCEGSW